MIRSHRNRDFGDEQPERQTGARPQPQPASPPSVSDVRAYIIAERDRWMRAEDDALAVIRDQKALLRRHRARYMVLNDVLNFIDGDTDGARRDHDRAGASGEEVGSDG